MSFIRQKPTAELQRLVAAADIRTLLVRDARAVDRIDLDLLRACYHPDATVDVVDYAGDIEGYIAYLRSTLPGFVSTTHFLGSHEVEIDGDVAFAETLCIESLRVPSTDGKPERDVTGIMRYGDRLERRDGQWRIAQRVVVLEPGRIDEVQQNARPWNGGGIRDVAPRDLLRPGMSPNDATRAAR